MNLEELAAQTDDEFTKIATTLARDLNRLTELRSTLRERMKQSPLMNGKRFAQAVESAFQGMWQTYCATRLS
jgi:predicted O-linked N-acetylglucosamine transferase (SPINDLY family)